MPFRSVLRLYFLVEKEENVLSLKKDNHSINPSSHPNFIISIEGIDEDETIEETEQKEQEEEVSFIDKTH